jgi:hypothetical protein
MAGLRSDQLSNPAGRSSTSLSQYRPPTTLHSLACPTTPPRGSGEGVRRFDRSARATSVLPSSSYIPPGYRWVSALDVLEEQHHPAALPLVVGPQQPGYGRLIG